MFFVIIAGLAVVICVVYFVHTSKMNKNAKKCSCGKEYSYIDGDIIDYFMKKNDTLQTPTGKVQAIVTVRFKCSKCQKTEEKKVRVTYDPRLRETVEDGIRRLY